MFGQYYFLVLIFVDISNTADLQAVRFTAMSTKEDYKIKKKQKMQFRQYCLKYFKTMVSLFDRFCGA